MQNCSRSVRRTMSSGSTSAARSGKFSTSFLIEPSNFDLGAALFSRHAALLAYEQFVSSFTYLNTPYVRQAT